MNEPVLDLSALQSRDPQAFQLGWQLNDSSFGGTDLDGHPEQLRWSEFVQGGTQLWRRSPSLALQNVLKRLEEWFVSAGQVAPTPSTPVVDVPAERGQIKHRGHANRIDMGATGWTGGSTLVFDSSSQSFDRSGLFVSRSGEAPRPLPLTTQAINAGPSAVTIQGKKYLYFESSDALFSRPTLYRSTFSGSVPGKLEVVNVPGVDWVGSWPRFFQTRDGGVAVAYRDGNSRLSFGLSDDGINFRPTSFIEGGSAMPAAAQMKSGRFAFTYQTGVTPMISYVRTSDDGVRWSAPQRVSDLSQNIHDTTLVARDDGGLDLYYSVARDVSGFQLFRRALMPDGRLGPEQQLTRAGEGEITKPEVVRARNGARLVTFAEIVSRSPAGEPDIQRMGSFTLTSDAPLPVP